MSIWDSFPANYRSAEATVIRTAVKAGECAAVVGLSGAGKSNLLGYAPDAAKVVPAAHQFAAPCGDLVPFRALGRG